MAKKASYDTTIPKYRHQLLSEDRYSIYLLYAAGEMVLVVTGILLALQIDNWKYKYKAILIDIRAHSDLKWAHWKQEYTW